MNWPKVKLESLSTKERYSMIGGPFGSNLTSNDYVEEGIPVIRGVNLNKGRYLDTEGFVYVTETKVWKDLKSNLSKPLDMIFTQRGTLGQVAIIPADAPFGLYVISQSQMKMTVDETKADRMFLYYCFTSNDTVNRIKNHASSSGVPHINLNVLRNFEIVCPPLLIQKKISSILSSYDDLIENNRRRIQLLEESARLLYNEWFVHLRFPGHEHTRIKDGVPEEWAKCTTIDVLDVMSGGTPKTKNSEYWDGDIPFFTPKDATDSIYVLSTEKTLSDKGLKTCNSKFYPRNTLFITARGTVGRINLAQKSMAMNQSCYALKAKVPLNQFFMYCALKASISQFTSRASGAVFDAIVVDTFKLIPFLKPAKSIIDLFTEIIEPIFTQIETLLLQNQKLAQARDILLPKLMNGEIEV